MTRTRRFSAVCVLAAAVPVLTVTAALAAPGRAHAFVSGSLHTTVEAVATVLAAFFSLVALRAYTRDGTVRLAVLGGALGAYAAVSAPESVFPTLHTLSLYGTFGSAALVLLAVTLTALPVRAVTRDRVARSRIVASIVVALGFLALVAMAFGVRLAANAPVDASAWRTTESALDAVACLALVAAMARLVRADARGDTVSPVILLALGVLAGQSAMGPFVAPWTLAWWLVHVAAIAGVLTLVWATFLMAVACERTASALSAAETRSERLSSLGTLVAGVAHEINNPLLYVRGNVELAALDVEDALHALRAHGVTDAPDLARTAEQLRESLEGTDRIARITKSLRAVVREDSDAHDVVDLADVVASAGELVTIGNPEHVTVTVHAGDARVPIRGSGSDLHQIVLNLVRNAVEALGDAPGHVHVRVTHRDRVAELTVTDSGPGIPEDVKRKLFTPFFTTKNSGTGLGLAIVHAIVDEHGGRILVDSTPGEGTTFTVRFPVTAPNAVEERFESLL